MSSENIKVIVEAYIKTNTTKIKYSGLYLPTCSGVFV